MANDNGQNRTAIIVALIGALAAIIAALLPIFLKGPSENSGKENIHLDSAISYNNNPSRNATIPNRTKTKNSETDKKQVAKQMDDQNTDISTSVKSVTEDYVKEVKDVQIQAKFPGGDAEWRRYLEKNLNRDVPVNKGAPVGVYTVTVSFLVNKDGSISEVNAINNPGYGTAEEVIRVISQGPKWLPAVQNGRNVIYRQKQSLSFSVTEE